MRIHLICAGVSQVLTSHSRAADCPRARPTRKLKFCVIVVTLCLLCLWLFSYHCNFHLHCFPIFQYNVKCWDVLGLWDISITEIWRTELTDFRMCAETCLVGQYCGKVQDWNQQLEAAGFPGTVISLHRVTRRRMPEYTSQINQSRRRSYLSNLLIDSLRHANLRLHVSIFVRHT